MKPYYDHAGITLYHGDCREAMAALPDASVDAVVTDPPYGLSFMGKRWDYDVPGVDVWQQVLRVLKPGGHLLAFAGTRTQHRMAVRIEDAGFEIRDMIAWVYGSGFPKSLDVSKAIDKAAGAERELGPKRVSADGTVAHDRAGARHEGYERPWRSDPDAVDRNTRISYPATPEARQWSGWGTALKPALEPITVARKPLIGTVAQNVLEHGTGALNIDGCRVGRDAEDVSGWSQSGSKASDNRSMSGGNYAREAKPDAAGRWPANLIHDGSDEVVGLFPETDEEQSAARFFYTAKADKSDRGHGNNHPTVKPVDLMRYLVRLVCPMDGIVLDPFNGSGTTAVASRAEHCRYIGAELNEDYCRITVERLAQGGFVLTQHTTTGEPQWRSEAITIGPRYIDGLNTKGRTFMSSATASRPTRACGISGTNSRLKSGFALRRRFLAIRTNRA